MSVETQQPAQSIRAVGESAAHVNSNVASFRINVPALLRWLETTVDGETAAKLNGKTAGPDQVDGERRLQSQDLLDASLPNTVLRRIDTRAQPLPATNSDFQGRMQNWETLLQNINSFYQEVLQQYVTNSFPNAVEIAANAPNALEHAARSVLLVLGAAVQCEQRADYIDAIRRLNEEEQITLIEHIREVTDESRSVCPLEECLSDNERSDLVSRLYRHIVALMSQRASLYQLLKEAHLTSERLRVQLLEQSAAADARADCDSLNATANGSELASLRHGTAALLHSTAMRRSRSASLLNVSASLTNNGKDNQSLQENGVDADESNDGDVEAQTESETANGAASDQTAAGLVQRLQLELAQARGAARRLRAEADERADALAETSEQLDAANRELARLKTECVQLAHEARQSRALRDEADVLRERALRADRLELELGKARERLADLEFFRQRAEELREDTIMLEEARTLLSGRLEAAHKRLETVAELEHELTRARQSLSEIGRERDSQRDLMNDLLRELDLLRAEKARLVAAASDRDAVDAAEPRKLNELDASVSDQIANAVQTRLTRVELENEKLRAQLAAAANGSGPILNSSSSSAMQNQLEKLQAAFNNEQQARSELDKELRALKRSRAAVADYVAQVETQMNQLVLTVELFASTRNNGHQRQPSADQQKLPNANGTTAGSTDTTGPTVMVTVGQEEASRIGETSVEIDRLRLPAFATYAPFCPRCNRKLVLLKQPPAAPSAIAGSAAARTDAESQSDATRASELESGPQRPASLTDPSSDAALDPDDPHHSDVVEARRTTFRHSMRLLEARESRVRELETDNDALLAKCSSMETRARELDEARTRDAAELAAIRRERAELTASLERERAHTASAETRANQLDAALRDAEARAELLGVRSDELRNAQLALDALRAEFTKLNETLCTAQLDAAKARRETDAARTACDELRAARDSLDRELRAAQRATTDLRLATARADHADAELRDARDREATLRRAVAQLQDDLAAERRRVQQADAERELARADADAAERRVDEMRCTLEEAHRSTDTLRTHFEEQRTEAERLRERVRVANEQLERTKTATLTVDASSTTQQPKLSAIATQSEPTQQNEPEVVLQRRAADLGASPSPSPSLTADMDKLLELERANARMEAELVQSRSAEARAAAALADAQRQLERRSAQLETLHDEKAALETTVRSVQAQSLELATQHGDRQAALHRAELDAERLRHSHAQLAADYRELVAEHEHLQTDFDALRADLQRRKAACKQHKAELRTARVELQSAAADRERAAALTAACERERAEAHEARTRLHAATAESRELAARCARLERDHEALLSEHKAARTELNEARLANLDQQGDLQECRDQLSSLDVELDKLTNQLKLANSFREQLEAENGSLLSQLDALVSQNQDLLNRLLEHRETHLAEREQLRTQLERLADQRQSLETRMLETQRDAAVRAAEYEALLRDADERVLTAQRPASPSAKKKQSFGATLMRKARGFMGKRTKSNSQLNLASDVPANGVPSGPNDSPTRTPEQNTNLLDKSRSVSCTTLDAYSKLKSKSTSNLTVTGVNELTRVAESALETQASSRRRSSLMLTPAQQLSLFGRRDSPSISNSSLSNAPSSYDDRIELYSVSQSNTTATTLVADVKSPKWTKPVQSNLHKSVSTPMRLDLVGISVAPDDHEEHSHVAPTVSTAANHSHRFDKSGLNDATPQPQRRAASQLGQPITTTMSQAHSRLWTPQPFASTQQQPAQQNTSMDSTSHTNLSSSLSQQLSGSQSTHSTGLANQTTPSPVTGSQTYVLAARAMTPSRGNANDQRDQRIAQTQTLTATARQETLSTPPRFMPPPAGSTQSKLVAGSMSVFDRTPPHSPRPGASSGGDTVELLSFLRELNEKAERRERDKAERDKAHERDRHRHVQRKLSMSFGLSKANARSTPDLTKAGVKSDASSVPQANGTELAGERTSTPKKQIGLDAPDGSPQSAGSVGQPAPVAAGGIAQHDSAMKRVLSPYLVQFQDVQTLRRKGSPLDSARTGSSASRPSTATPTTWARLATPLPANHDLPLANVNGDLARPSPRPVVANAPARANSRTLPSRPGTAMADPAGSAASQEQPANSLRPITPALTAGTAAYRESPLGRPQPQASLSQTLPSRRHTQSVTPSLQQQLAAQTDQQTLSAVQRPQSSLDQPAPAARTNRHHTIVGLAAAPSPLGAIQEQHNTRVRPPSSRGEQLNGSSIPFARQPGLPPENERVERTLLRVRSSAFTMPPNEANRLVELQSRPANSTAPSQPRRGPADDLYAPPSNATIEKSMHHSRSAQSMASARRSKTPAPSSSSSYYDTSMLQSGLKLSDSYSEAASYQAQPAANQARQTTKPYRPASTQPVTNRSANYESSPQPMANGRPAPAAVNAYQQAALQSLARPHSSMAQPVSAQLIRSRSPNPALLRNVVSPNSTPYGQAASSLSPSSSASSNKSSQHAARLAQTNSADSSFI